MAKKKQEEAPKGSPAWMATFSDLMNLLLCFFVLLFSMSSVDQEKFQEVVASLQSAMSILPSGGAAIGDGQLVSAGVRQLEFLDSYYKEMSNSASDDDNKHQGDKSDQSIADAYKEAALQESEQMAESIENEIEKYGIQDMVEVDFNAEYVQISLSGAILFDSGAAELIKEAYPVMDKICVIIGKYKQNIIEVEGHSDNVPLGDTRKYEDNMVLSMYRAYSVANYLRDKSKIEDSHIKSSGRGEYVPIADNSTADGRARNRRVEIKIYNSYNSNTN